MILGGFESLSMPSLDTEEASRIGRSLAAMDPWATLGYSPEALARGLTFEHPESMRHLIRRDGEILALATVRAPWLRGAYIELFAVLPHAQGQGIGEALLALVESSYRTRTDNLWLLVSGFNARARRFYERHGFGSIGSIPDLVVIGQDEILMRKRLGQTGTRDESR
jgi:diamine N-acetyltransferase